MGFKIRSRTTGLVTLGVILLVIAGLLTSMGCSSPYQAYLEQQDSPAAHYGVDGFTNPHTDEIDKNAIDFFKMRWFGDEEWADQTQENMPVTQLPANHFAERLTQPRLTWLGHATFVVELDQQRIMTDPILSERASPFSFAGPERLQAPPLAADALPTIDVVIISHNHYDHLDEATIKQLLEQAGGPPLFVVPLGLRAWFTDIGTPPERVVELDWWQTTEHQGITYTATPSQHWSARSLFDRMETLWASWRIDGSEKSVWFGGDTGYNDQQFKQISERLGPVDIALLPIGAYEPRWFMRAQHTNPADAALLHQDIRARQSYLMHYGSYQLSAESLAQTFADVEQVRANQQLRQDEFVTWPIGSSVNF